MQRIYGTAFATQEELDAWLKQREEAEKRDHRKLGRELDLFSIYDDYGQGLILWHPKGGIIRNEMERLLKEELEKRGYSFVFTPHIAKRDLWVTSGHEGNYADSMYAPTSIEDEEYRLKPMNCPFHIGIYKSSPAFVSRSAAALFRNGYGLSCRAFGNAARPDACSWIFGR